MLPIITERYWYFSAYFIVFLLIPVLNKIIDSFSQKSLRAYLILFFGLFSLSVLIPYHYGFNLNSGYSWAWLSYLYLIGAYHKKYSFESRVFNKPGLIFVLTVFCSWFINLFIATKLHDIINVDVFNYTWPLNVIGSVSLLVFFDKLKVKTIFQQPILKISNLVFGVYLVHVHTIMWNNVIANHFKDLVNYGVIKYLIIILFATLFIFAFGVIIEFLRVELFKFIKIDKYLDKISDKIESYFN